MLLIIAVLVGTLTFTCALLPMTKAAALRTRRESEETYRAFQLQTVSKHYQDLRKMSYREIEERFHLESIYNDIR